MDRTGLERKSLAELRQIAAALELKGYQRVKKADLVELIVNAGAGAASEGAEPVGEDLTPPAAAAPADDGAAARTRARPRARRRDEDAETSGGAQRRDDARDREPTRDGDARDGGSETDHGGDRGEGRDDRGGDDRGGDGRDGGDDRSTRDQDEASRGKRERRRKNRGPGPGGQGQGEDLDEAEVREGVLDLLPEGYGFLRVTGYLSGDRDVYVSQSFVRRHALRRGDRVAGPIRRNKSNDKFPALARVDAVEGVPFADIDPQRPRPGFDELTALFPDERLMLTGGERTPDAVRLVDLVAPVGKGQRGLLVSPPKAGKTTLLTQLAAAIRVSDPDVELMVVLVDGRPEEVTDVARSAGCEVISSTFDRPAEDHTQVAELAIERAKRLAERGRDVVVLLDSLTRLARAYNVVAPSGGKTLSGGVDATALYPVKRFFAAARKLEEGGSLTILATALVETGAAVDEVILDEFQGTANLELRLDGALARARAFPAVDVVASGTRREDLLAAADGTAAVDELHRQLAELEPAAALRRVLDDIGRTDTNEQLVASLDTP